jgi:hypothetical protein
MKRKAAKSRGAGNAKPAAPQSKPVPPPQAREEWDAELVAAGAKALGLKLDPSWEAGIEFNLRLILRHAALVEEFVLPDDAESAPIFHA